MQPDLQQRIPSGSSQSSDATASSISSPAPPELKTISHYRILTKLGAGGMGEVLLAEDQVLGRKVAIKILRARPGDEESHRRLLHEARTASTLDHPNICAIHEVGEEGDRAFLVMQYVEGVTLSQRLQGRPLDLEQSLEIAVQICDALAEAHARGVIHRDVKPQNIMVTAQNRVKVLDFGLAKKVPLAALDAESEKTPSFLSQPGTMIGTIAYMSPEQSRGSPVDFQTDLFSLGTLLYEMLSGQHPFKRKSATATLAAIQLIEPPSLSRIARVPPQLDWIVQKCLRKDKEQRYSSARELCLDLKQLREDLEGKTEINRRRSLGRRAILYWGISVAVTVLAFWAWRHFSPPDGAPGSIVVLPFKNESGSPEGDPYCRGIAELTSSVLSENPNITVAPTLPTDPGADPLKLGRDLRVAAVLQGKLLTRSQGQCVFWAAVLNVAAGKYRANQTFNLPCADVVSTQQQLAHRITEMLQIDVSAAQQQRMYKRRPMNDDAWQSYLDGLAALGSRSLVGMDEAIEHFNRSIRSDPKFAPAYAAISSAYALKAKPAEICIPAATRAAQTALELDASLGEAHAALAFIRGHYEWRWEEAATGFRRALELNPNYATGYQWYADLLMARGQNSEAREMLERAAKIDPRAAIVRADMVLLYFYGRNPDLAISEGQRTVGIYPSLWFAHFYLAKAYLLKAQYSEAIAALNQAWELLGATQALAAHLVYAHGRAGHMKEAQGFFRSMESIVRENMASSYNLAIAHIGLGENEKALQNLEAGVKEHDPQLMYLKVDPLLDSVRPDPRFALLLQRMNLGKQNQHR